MRFSALTRSTAHRTGRPFSVPAGNLHVSMHQNHRGTAGAPAMTHPPGPWSARNSNPARLPAVQGPGSSAALRYRRPRAPWASSSGGTAGRGPPEAEHLERRARTVESLDSLLGVVAEQPEACSPSAAEPPACAPLAAPAAQVSCWVGRVALSRAGWVRNLCCLARAKLAAPFRVAAPHHARPWAVLCRHGGTRGRTRRRRSGRSGAMLSWQAASSA